MSLASVDLPLPDPPTRATRWRTLPVGDLSATSSAFPVVVEPGSNSADANRLLDCLRAGKEEQSG